MPCDKCKTDLPLLTGYKVVGESRERQAIVKICNACSNFYEQQAFSWVGPKELTDEELKEFYPDLYKRFR